MTGFQLLEALTKMDKEALRSDIFAGLNDEDRIVDAYVTSDGFVSLLTEAARATDAEETERQAEEERLMQEEYWKNKRDEWAYDDYVQERIRRIAE